MYLKKLNRNKLLHPIFRAPLLEEERFLHRDPSHISDASTSPEVALAHHCVYLRHILLPAFSLQKTFSVVLINGSRLPCRLHEKPGWDSPPVCEWNTVRQQTEICLHWQKGCCPYGGEYYFVPSTCRCIYGHQLCIPKDHHTLSYCKVCLWGLFTSFMVSVTPG